MIYPSQGNDSFSIPLENVRNVFMFSGCIEMEHWFYMFKVKAIVKLFSYEKRDLLSP